MRKIALIAVLGCMAAGEALAASRTIRPSASRSSAVPCPLRIYTGITTDPQWDGQFQVGGIGEVLVQPSAIAVLVLPQEVVSAPFLKYRKDGGYTFDIAHQSGDSGRRRFLLSLCRNSVCAYRSVSYAERDTSCATSYAGLLMIYFAAWAELGAPTGRDLPVGMGLGGAQSWYERWVQQ